MKTIWDKRGKKGGFTIVELLTVMSIIILLISLLVPALTRVRRYAQFVKQKAQFHSIGIALDLFNSEQQGYPPSDRYDGSGAAPPVAYCGAMKLAEAMLGQDLLGFNPNSHFRRDGTIDGTAATQLYPANPGTASPQYPAYVENVKSRRLYLQLENANAARLTDIYTPAHLTGSAYASIFDPNFVICDVYMRTMATGNKTGMPILYFKANTSKTEHDATLVVDCVSANNNTYNRCDNQDLVDIPLPWITPVGPHHPMASAFAGWTTLLGTSCDPAIFYKKTKDPRVTTAARPYRADSYILMSAGFDGEYGTSDDVFNFGE
jgi:type II secretory pathway pseudopilin PulG